MSQQDTIEHARILTILTRLGLPHAHVAYVEHASRAGAPYHNAAHCVSVACRCFDGAEHYGLDPVPLTLAGLYHDAGHAGHSDDEENISAALAVYGRDDDDVARLIRATQFPPSTPPATMRLDEQVIRDADALQHVTDPTGEWGSRLAEECPDLDVSVEWARGALLTGWGRSFLPPG